MERLTTKVTKEGPSLIADGRRGRREKAKAVSRLEHKQRKTTEAAEVTEKEPRQSVDWEHEQRPAPRAAVPHHNKNNKVVAREGGNGISCWLWKREM